MSEQDLSFFNQFLGVAQHRGFTLLRCGFTEKEADAAVLECALDNAIEFGEVYGDTLEGHNLDILKELRRELGDLPEYVSFVNKVEGIN